MRHKIEAAGLAHRIHLDSAGTGGWHAGKRPDERMRHAASTRGYDLSSFARQVTEEDLAEFDLVLRNGRVVNGSGNPAFHADVAVKDGTKGYDREGRADPQLSGGGELIDQGVHLIDLAGWILGEFPVVEGHAATHFWDMKVDDNAFLSLRTATGQTAWLHASCTEWKNLFSLELYGRKAKIAIDGLGGSYGVERLSFFKMLPEMGPPETTIYE